MSQNLRQFSPQFKAEAVQFVIETGRPVVGRYNFAMGTMHPVAYREHVALADLHFARAIGDQPEMECSKEAARIVAELPVSSRRVIADVGCGSGHYLRSLNRVLEPPFAYVGIEYHDLFIERAQRAWAGKAGSTFRQGSIFQIPASDNEFSLTICSNLLMHVPTIVRPIEELIRVTSRNILIRTMIGLKTYKVQEVYNKSFWPSSSVDPASECQDDGEPIEYEYENIWGEQYFRAVISRFAPNAEVKIWEDVAWLPDAVQGTRDSGLLPNATKVVDGKQVFDYLILPYHWVLVTL